MSPIPLSLGAIWKRDVLPKPSDPDGLVLEAWAQGYMVGSLIIMAFITMANMRRGILLHKLILLELVLGIWQGFWLFFRTPIYAWWLSIGAIFLNASWSLHNVISWMKIKPFLSRPVSWAFIGSVILVQPYWITEIYANFAYFHGANKIFEKTRPWEALCRDPWWIFTTIALLWTIKTQYELTLSEILRISPRFGIMLFSMVISIIFIILDICSVTGAFESTLPVGINPFWKLAFVFKCLTDMVVLDDFKTALDRLRAFKISRIGSFCQDNSDRRTFDNNNNNLTNTWEELAAGLQRDPVHGEPLPSPDGDLVNPSNFPPSRSSSRLRLSNMTKQQKDSAHSTEHVSPNLGVGRDPEDIVPSALYGPAGRPEMRSLAPARGHQTRNDQPSDGGMQASSVFQNDYARAMREMHGQNLGPANNSLGAPSPGASSGNQQRTSAKQH